MLMSALAIAGGQGSVPSSAGPKERAAVFAESELYPFRNEHQMLVLEIGHQRSLWPIIPALRADIKCHSIKKLNCLLQLSLCNAFLARFELCVCFLKDFTNALARKKQQPEI